MSDKHFKKKNFNILIGITGSVASIKLEELVNKIVETFINSYEFVLDYKLNICIIPTNNAKNFIENFDLKFNKNSPTLSERLSYLRESSNESSKTLTFSFTDEDEWSSWSKRDDPVLHIELRKWADLLLIAPLDANSLAKMSNGLCDNLLTCIVRAWDLENIKKKPIIVCPAMNTCMYKHPLTKIQLDLLVNQFGFTLIEPIEKKLMCGDTGIGAMASIETIVKILFNLINSFYS